MKPKNNENEEETRYCKKCGCELASTNKHKLCEDCRRTRNKKIRDRIAIFVGVIGLGIVAQKNFGELKENTNATENDGEDDYSVNDSDSIDSNNL